MPVEVVQKPREHAYFDVVCRVTGISNPVGTTEKDIRSIAISAAAIDYRTGTDDYGMKAFNASYKAGDLEGTMNAMLAIAMIARDAALRNMEVVPAGLVGRDMHGWAAQQTVAETQNAIEAAMELRRESVGKPFGSTPSDAKIAIERMMDSGKLDFRAARRGGPVL